MNFRLGLILAGSLALVAGGCAASSGASGGDGTVAPTPGGEILRQGERPRETDDTEAAEEAIEQAEAAAGEAAARPHWQTALQAAERAIQADSTNPLPWLQAGIANMGLGNYQAADEALSRATELRPIYELEVSPIREQQWINLYQEGAELTGQGDWEGARERFEGADAIYRERPEAMLALGQVYNQLNMYDEAIDAFRRAEDVVEATDMEAVDSATAAQWRESVEQIPLQVANALMLAERYDEAVTALQELVAEDPDNVALSRTLASLYVQLDRPAEATEVYNDLLGRPDLGQDDYYQIGLGLYQIESYEEAADAFAEAAAMSRYDRDAAEMWARSLQIAFPPGEGNETPPQRLEELHEAAEMWLELDPFNQNSYLVLAQTHARSGNQERAGELVNAREDLTVMLDNLALRRGPQGGATLTAQLINQSAEPGTTVTLDFTFYGAADNVVATETVRVQAPAEGANEPFQVDVNTDDVVAGYTYEIRGM